MKFCTRLCTFACTLVMAVSLFAGCAANSVSASTDAAPTEEKSKVVVWTHARHDYDYMKSVVDNYNATNTDNIEIELEVFTDNFVQAVELAYDTGGAPDVMTNPGLLDRLYPSGKLEPLNDYLTEEDYEYFGKSSFVETVNMFDGKIYSTPATGTSIRLFYNQDIFDKAGITEVPKTLDDVVTAAKTITEKLKGDGVYGFAINLKNPASALSRSADPIVMMNGSCNYNYDTAQFDYTEYKPVLAAFKEIFDSGAAFPGCDQLDIDPLRTQFAAGKIGMYFSYTHAEPGVYANQFPTTENWNCTELPTVDGTIRGSQGNGAGTWWMMNSQSKVKEAAWKVIRMFTSKEVLIPYHEQGLGLCVIDSVIKEAKQPEVIAKMPYINMQPTDKTWPSKPSGFTLEGEDYYSMFAGYILGNPKYSDIDSIISDLNTRYNEAYQKGITDGTSKLLQFPGFDPADPAKAMK